MSSKKKTNLLFVTRSYPPVVGGMENYAYYLLTGLNETPELKIKSLINKHGKDPLFLPLFFIQVLFYSLFFGYKQDVYYAHDGLTAFFLLPAKMLYKKKLIFTIHGLDFIFPFKENTSFYKKTISWIYRSIYTQAVRYGDVLVANSKATKQKFEQLYTRNDLVVINPGIIPNAPSKITEFTRRQKKEKIFAKYFTNQKYNHNVKIILFLGRLIEKKGIIWFTESVFPKLNKDYYLLIAGDGHLKNVLVNTIKEKKLSKRARILGFIVKEEKKDVLLGSDLMIMPNIILSGDFPEGFGISIIDAGFYGLPVVASAVGGITDAIVNKKNGYLFKEKNVSDCINKIKLAENLSSNNDKLIKFVKERFTYKVNARKYLNLITVNNRKLI